MVFDYNYITDEARGIYENEPDYFGEEMSWEDFEDRFVEEFYEPNESYDLFAREENFFVDKVPEEVLAENRK
jgi:hypothetical protein